MNYDDTLIAVAANCPVDRGADGQGTVRLLPMESDEYHRLVTSDDSGVTALEALRPRRA